MGTKHEGYRLSLTLWKALWTFLQTSIGVGAGVIAIEMPASWEEFQAQWPVLLVPVAIATARALNNARKHLEWFRLPWEKAAAVLLTCAVLVSGCASHVCRLKETVSTPDPETGAVIVTKTNVQDYSWAWWKSTLDEGAGNVKYNWGPEEVGAIELGSTSTGLMGGDGTELILGVMQLMAPILNQWVAAQQSLGLAEIQRPGALSQVLGAVTSATGSASQEGGGTSVGTVTE